MRPQYRDGGIVQASHEVNTQNTIDLQGKSLSILKSDFIITKHFLIIPCIDTILKWLLCIST